MKEESLVSLFYRAAAKNLLLLGLLFGSAGFSRAADHVVISEFLAGNEAGLVRDQNGDKSDWIELRNLGIEPVDLSGWHLTDTATNLTRWTFPATTIQPGQFLLVFASGKDRTNTGQLHTSFSLALEPGFLALVRPDGTNIAHAYSPTYPAQLADLSYGISPTFETNALVAAEAPLRWLVPTEGPLPDGWTLPEFDDALWAEGTNGLGYGEEFAHAFLTDTGAMANQSPSVLARLPFFIAEDDLPEPDLFVLRVRRDDGFVAYLNGIEVARRNAPDELAWNSAATAEHWPASFEEIALPADTNLLRVGTNVLAVHGLNIARDDIDYLLEPRLEVRTILLGEPAYFSPPTHGKPNINSVLGFVADTKFSVDRGFYEVPFTVAITTATTGAEIRYTTNGSAPSAVFGEIYQAPVPIGRTTVLRAIAVKPGFRPSNVDTHTYVFLANVLTQSVQSATSRGFPSSWGQGADYAMDSRVVATNTAAVRSALSGLPSMFISTSVSNLFDGARGIYQNATQSGAAWERPASVEFVGTNGQTEFQEDAGLRIQGGAFRNFFFTQKKSFRVLFKKQYGAGKLDHRLFAEPGSTDEFDGFVLRAGANDSYGWADAGTTVQFIRDEFGRSLQRDMGHPSPHGRFVHLYLNGLYWGLYNLVERPNEDFSASYLGGEPEQWDANNAGEFKNGGTSASSRWSQFHNAASNAANYTNYLRAQGLDPAGVPAPSLIRQLDAPNLIDYMLLNIWGGNWDWPFKNYWFGYSTTNRGTGYKFYVWDFENTMGNNRMRSPLNMVSPQPSQANTGVGIPHYRFKNSVHYRNDFADRAHRWFFNGGLLTPEALTNRYRRLADAVEPAIIAESARWGDDNRATPLGLAEWRAERDWLLTNYLPRRSEIVLAQLKGEGLYPTVAAPAFGQMGGLVQPGHLLAMSQTNGDGAILFTLDGSDPRVPGAVAVSASAAEYSEAIPLSPPLTVRARVLRDGQWSALTEAFFNRAPDFSDLVLSELHYHPTDFGLLESDAYEFVELHNRGSVPFDLSGLAFTNGIQFAFTNGSVLSPGGHLVLARDATAFGARFPGVPVFGLFSGRLDNAGELLALHSFATGATLSFTYDDKAPWPEAADGNGPSLQLRSPDAPMSDPASWVAFLPSPGRAYDPTDGDGDGLPDVWETAHGLSIEVANAHADTDGDGLSNLQELIAGTHPGDAASSLRLVPTLLDADTSVLSLTLVSNRTYSLYESTSLDSAPWQKRLDLPAEPTNRWVHWTNPVPAGETRFFRAVTPAQP